MATNHYSLPTIVGTDTIDGVNAINGLANAVDTALYSVAGQIPQGYVLPIATAGALGGVRGGGEIVVNNSNGDMSIAAGVIDNTKMAANSVGSGNLQNNSVTASKLSADVTSQISAGYQASQTINAAPRQFSMNSTTGNAYGNYVVDEVAKIVTMKLYLAGAQIQVDASGWNNSNTPSITWDALPVQYRPSTNYDAMMGMGTSITGGNGVVTIWGAIRADGVPCVYYQNAWAGAGSYTFNGTCQLVWCYGVQSAD